MIGPFLFPESSHDSTPMTKTVWHPELLANVALVRADHSRVRDLAEFQRSHKVPTEYSDRACAFVTRLAAREIGADLESRYADFRQHLNFRRVDLQATEAGNGTGRISTPWFDYQISVTLDPADPTRIAWQRRICEFRPAAQLQSAEFAAVVGKQFDTVQLTPPEQIDLPDLIDRIENRGRKTVTLDYDRNATWCTVTVRNLPVCMRVTSDTVSFVTSKPMTAARLLEAFLKLRDQLLVLEA